MEELELRLKVPFTMVCSGATGSGKTTLVQAVLQNSLRCMTEQPKRLVIAYTCEQPIYGELEKIIEVKYVRGLPDDLKTQTGDVLVIDYLMGDKSVVPWFTKHSHHSRTSVIYLVQNFFQKENRTATLNAQYICTLKNPRDQKQMHTLAHQLQPTDAKFVKDAYEQATYKPHSYLLIDCTQTTNELLRYRSSIYPDEATMYVSEKSPWIPKEETNLYDLLEMIITQSLEENGYISNIYPDVTPMHVTEKSSRTPIEETNVYTLLKHSH